MMDAKELAQRLNRAEYPLHISRETRLEAKTAGLVIVYGASDDLMEFEGAISDEIGCYGGGSARLDAAGIIPDFESIDQNDKDALRDYFKRENGGKEIEALWDAGDGYSWMYKTEIPHETFEVVEDGEPYCRGIVFRMADVALTPPQAKHEEG